MLLYAVGMKDPHMAIGTSALSVAVNAFANLIPHARARHVRWKPALIFAAAGVVGALIGSTIGKWIDGRKLLILFALLILFIAGLMFRGRKPGTEVEDNVRPLELGKLTGIGGGTGILAGFFGIGGGFLVVPGLILATGMPTISAIGSSLVSVGFFGLTTGVNYAVSGLIEWPIALLFIAGGIVGGWAGSALAKRLAKSRQALTRVLGAVLVTVSIYMLYRSFT